MQRHSIFLLVLVGTIPLHVCAAVFERDWKAPGDGLLTYDDVNRREWLDLGETQLFKFPGDTLEERYQFVVLETGLGGQFDEFLAPNSDDVLAFAESAGIDITTLDFQTNQFAANALIDVVGETRDFEDTSQNRASSGIISVSNSTFVGAEVLFGPEARTMAFAGIEVTQFVGLDSGVWLFRPIPEPETALIAVLYGAIACSTRCLRIGS